MSAVLFSTSQRMLQCSIYCFILLQPEMSERPAIKRILCVSFHITERTGRQGHGVVPTMRFADKKIECLTISTLQQIWMVGFDVRVIVC